MRLVLRFAWVELLLSGMVVGAEAQAPKKEATVPPREEILARFAMGGDREGGTPSAPFKDGVFELGENEGVVFVGQENFVREQKAGELEALLAAEFAGVRPRFRSMAWEADTVYRQWRDLNFGSWAEQLQAAGATVVVAQFGQMEALDGPGRLTDFSAAYHRLLDEFAQHTRRVVLVSPMPFERPLADQAPDLTKRNDDVSAYAEAVRRIAEQRGAIYIDLTSLEAGAGERLTRDGIHLTPKGLKAAARVIAAELGARPGGYERIDLETVKQAVVRKNQLWFDCWRPANWTFAYGDRVRHPYGRAGGESPPLRVAFEQQRPFLEEADKVVYDVLEGAELPAPEPARLPLDEDALTPEEQLGTFEMGEGYEVNLFASEADGVVNPVQIAWDERGRLYVACSPSYPQTLATVPPRDYVLVLEDTDGDGRADRSSRLVEGLTMVQGVEPGAGGVYVCDFDRLLHVRDKDGDGQAEEQTVVFSGFGVGDTHQLINSICHGPDGSLWFSQGLHAMSRVETPHGIARLDRAGLWRFRPRELKLEGFFGGAMAGANCWGVAFDDFGQVFHKSGDRPEGYWSVPGMVCEANVIGSGSEESANVSYRNSPEQYHSVGPLFQTSPKTTSLAIVGTEAMPEAVQGCAVIAGFFGSVVEFHRFHDHGAGFKTTQLPKLMRSSNPAFRPVDVSMGPDGAIYLADWYNPVIGHYQASYADPRRDESHGRIWRITAQGHDGRVKVPDLATLNEAELIAQVGSKERWVRYQAKRLLFDGPTPEVVAALDEFVAEANPDDTLLRELIGVYAAHYASRPALLERLLVSSDFRVRAYATRLLGRWHGSMADGGAWLGRMVRDDHPRVRLEAVVAASYWRDRRAITVVTAALERPRDRFLDYAIRQSVASLKPFWAEPFLAGDLAMPDEASRTYLQRYLDDGPRVPSPGEELYQTACMVCHQPGGKGLPGVYPPLAGSEWVSGSKERLIKIVLHGLTGPVDVAGEVYGAGANSIPMPAMGGMTDEEIAGVLSYVRKAYGDGAEGVTPEDVRSVRERTAGRTAPWTAGELE